jgi:LCP family protein required for cell wall assembly
MYEPRYPRRGGPPGPPGPGPGAYYGGPPGPHRSPVRTVALVLLPFVLSGMAAVGAYFFPLAKVAFEQTGQHAASLGNGSPVATGAPFTLLLLGSDDDAKFQGNPLTQSMILVRVDPAAKQVTMLSIPRDLNVRLSNGQSGKIDQAYALGGPGAAVQTVESDLNVRVDYWAWIGLTGLVQLVDQVGGIDISPTNAVLDDAYPNDVNTQNPYGTERVAVLPGAQHLDGAQALQYVRSRHDDIREDFGRSFRQQQVLIALRAKARQLNAPDLPGFVGSLQGRASAASSRRFPPEAPSWRWCAAPRTAR